MSPKTWFDIKHLRSFLNFQIINLKSVKKLLKSYWTCIEYHQIASLKDPELDSFHHYHWSYTDKSLKKTHIEMDKI